MISIENICFSYKNHKIIDGINMELESNDIIGVVGPNGSGKTTLIRLISGVYSPDSGRILIDGHDIRSLKSKKLAQMVSVVPQNPNLPSGITVFDLISMGRNPHLKLFEWSSSSDSTIINSAMKMTNIHNLAHRVLDTLSDGERQRAVISMALAQESPVILLDEPASNLDIANQKVILNTISNSVHTKNLAALLTMHDLSLAAQYCNRIIMISDGKIVAEGSPEKVITEQNIFLTYKTKVNVISHPVTRKPVVIPDYN